MSLTDVQDSDEGNYTVVVDGSAGEIISEVATLALHHPPVIVTQPGSLTLNQGATAVFTVAVNGASPFTYQWEKDGVAIPGATAKTLALAGVTAAADAAGYRVAITNIDGHIISDVATLTVITPPAFTSEPVGVTNYAGTTASFSATVRGTAPGYQWFKITATATNALTDAGNISGSTSNVLTVANILGADDANYVLVASNNAGVVTSSNAVLSVIDPIITSEPANLTVNLGQPAAFTVAAYGTSPHYQWYKGATPITGANSATFNIASAADADAASYSVTITNMFGATNSASVTLTVIDPPVITVIGQPQSRTNNAGTTATFTVAFTGTTPSLQWYKLGGSPISGATSSTLTLTGVQDADATGYYVMLNNAAGTATSSTAMLTVIDPPVIVTQPSSRTNNASTTATFSVAVNGTIPFGYQWYKITPAATNALTDSGNISGTTGNTLTIANVLAVDQASYSVTITNPAGTVISSNALLVVNDPAILVQPAGTTNFDGSTVTLSVTAAGTTALAYQWYQEGVPVYGANSNALTMTNLVDGDAGHYTVVVTNSVGSVTSTPALLVTVAPLITTQPTNVTVLQGQAASFSVGVNGQTPFTYQWQLGGSSITGATNRIYSIGHATNSIDAGNYQVIVVNPIGIQTSIAAVLTVVVPPVITTPLTNVITVVGQTVQLGVTTTGTPLAYQWRLSSTNLPGANSATLTLNNVTTNNAGTYSVTVTNLGGTASSSATLTVYPTVVPVMAFSYTNHQFTLSLAGVPTYNYSIQTSSNLTDWTDLTTNVSPFTFTDTNWVATRVYRGKYLP